MRTLFEKLEHLTNLIRALRSVINYDSSIVTCVTYAKLQFMDVNCNKHTLQFMNVNCNKHTLQFMNVNCNKHTLQFMDVNCNLCIHVIKLFMHAPKGSFPQERQNAYLTSEP